VRRGRPCDLEQDVPVAKRTRARPQGSIILRRRGPFATPAGLESRFSLSRPFPCPFRARPLARSLARGIVPRSARFTISATKEDPPIARETRLGSAEGRDGRERKREKRIGEGKEKKRAGRGGQIQHALLAVQTSADRGR